MYSGYFYSMGGGKVLISFYGWKKKQDIKYTSSYGIITIVYGWPVVRVSYEGIYEFGRSCSNPGDGIRTSVLAL